VDGRVKPVYRIRAWREDGWWLAQVIGASDGADQAPLNALTQARSLARVEPMSRDLVATVLDAGDGDFDVEVEYDLPGSAGELVTQVRGARACLDAAQGVWQERSAAAARALTAQGYSLREAAALLGLSHQRVGQLLDGPADRGRGPALLVGGSVAELDVAWPDVDVYLLVAGHHADGAAGAADVRGRLAECAADVAARMSRKAG